jgi:putative solute:sodium symporter small subunit
LKGYWEKTKQLTIGLLLVWFVVTFVMNWFAREANQISLFGFPLGYYMVAQGIMIIYLGIIWFYNRQMNRLDEKFSLDNE